MDAHDFARGFAAIRQEGARFDQEGDTALVEARFGGRYAGGGYDPGGTDAQMQVAVGARGKYVRGEAIYGAAAADVISAAAGRSRPRSVRVVRTTSLA